MECIKIIQPYFLLYSHAPQFQWLSIFAKYAADKYAIQSVLLVDKESDAILAKKLDFFEVCALEKYRVPINAIDKFGILDRLKYIESKFGSSELNESVAMDRHLEKSKDPTDEVYIQANALFSVVDTVIQKYSLPKLVIVEPNFFTKRLLYMMVHPIPSVYIYQLTKFDLRIYFDYSMGYDWSDLATTYASIDCNQIPSHVEDASLEAYELNFLNYNKPFEQILIANKSSLTYLLSPVTIFSKIKSAIIEKQSELFGKPYRYLKRIHSVYSYGRVSKSLLSESEYAVFFLHYQPEHTVEGVAFAFRDQIQTAITIAASLPFGCRLIVKEHPAMLGQRATSDYKPLLSTPNIVIVNNSVPQKELLKNSKIIFTLSGTVALEGLILGVPVITLGKIFYNYFYGIFYFDKKMADLKFFIADVISQTEQISKESKSNSVKAIAAIIMASYKGKFNSIFSMDEMTDQLNMKDLRLAFDALINRVLQN